MSCLPFHMDNENVILEGRQPYQRGVYWGRLLQTSQKFTYCCCRDKSVIVWTLTKEEGTNYGYARKRLTGHSHFVENVVISSDGQFALSGSWDGTLRLWDLNTGITTRRFLGHTKDVLSVAFSADNRQVGFGAWPQCSTRPHQKRFETRLAC